MDILPGALCLLVFVVGLEAHDTFPNHLWPLTLETRETEVLFGSPPARISGTPRFDKVEPRLGYPALKLSGQSQVDIEVAGQFTPKDFMLMGMFYFNPKETNHFFRYVNEVGKIIFEMYIQSCRLYLYSGTSPNYGVVEKSFCPNSCSWYTIVLQWESKKAKAFMVLATTSDDEGQSVLDFEAKNGFEDIEYMPTSGNLTVGKTDGGVDFSVCCLRIYEERFDKHHVEKEMWEDCKRKAYWSASTTNPCRDKPCLNGGSCAPFNDSMDYTCRCRPWFEGKDCQTEKGMAHRQFQLIGHVTPGKLVPMENAVNVSARSRCECGTFCLREDACLSFTFTATKLCTLYDDFTSEVFNHSMFWYYIPKTDTTY